MFLSLTEVKVAKFEENPKEKQPEVRALRDPDIAILAGGSVNGLASSAYSKHLLAESEYQYIINGGNEAKMFILALLDIIARQIREDPDLLETFITEVLDRIGPPVSNLGERLRKSFSLNKILIYLCIYMSANCTIDVVL